jgi:hypothetical protein
MTKSSANYSTLGCRQSLDFRESFAKVNGLTVIKIQLFSYMAELQVHIYLLAGSKLAAQTHLDGYFQLAQIASSIQS